MQSSNILIFGSNGQLAWELFATLSPLGQVQALSSRECNLADPEQIKTHIRNTKPKLVVNAAAYTAVDKAESESELAFAVNAVAPGVMAQECALHGIPFVHYSTDYVFNGTAQSPYVEDTPTDPQNVYGKSKRDGELAVLDSLPNALIFRTSWVYGSRGNNFLRTIRRLARERDELKVVNDQVGSPTWSRGIAEVTAAILSQGIQDLRGFFQEFGGTYHLTSAGQTTWFDFAKTILDNDPCKQVNKIKHLIPIPTSEYPTPAKRPEYSVLSNQKMLTTFGVALPDWKEQLSTVLRELS